MRCFVTMVRGKKKVFSGSQRFAINQHNTWAHYSIFFLWQHHWAPFQLKSIVGKTSVSRESCTSSTGQHFIMTLSWSLLLNCFYTSSHADLPFSFLSYDRLSVEEVSLYYWKSYCCSATKPRGRKPKLCYTMLCIYESTSSNPSKY